MQLTSQLAFAEIRPKISKRQQAVYTVLKTHGPMTDRELKDVLGWEINAVVPRRNELAQTGVVQLHERRTCKSTGRNAIAWKITN